MRIEIKNDNENWLNWGKLVRSWIENPATRPGTVGDLRTQLTGNCVTATVQGTPDRVVVIQSYLGPGDPLLLMLPTRAMLDERFATVHEGPYQLPLFYDTAFGGAKRVEFSEQQAKEFALRRVGEYSVNECC